MLPAPQVTQERDLGRVVDELIEHVQDVRDSGPIGVVASDRPDLVAQALVGRERQVCVPAVVGSVQQGQRPGGCRWRSASRVVAADRIALRGDVEPFGRPVLAVHVDQVPQPPGDRRERFGLGGRQRQIAPPAVVALADRPAPRRKLPEVLGVGQAVEPASESLPHLVGQIDQFLLPETHGIDGT